MKNLQGIECWLIYSIFRENAPLTPVGLLFLVLGKILGDYAVGFKTTEAMGHARVIVVLKPTKKKRTPMGT